MCSSTTVPCISGGPRILPRLPLLCYSTSQPPQAIFEQPILVLSPHLPSEAPVSLPSLPCPNRPASQAGECQSALNPLWSLSLLCCPQTCYCALFWGSKIHAPIRTDLPTNEWTSLCVETFHLSQFPLRGTGDIAISFSFIFLLSYPSTWRFSCPFRGLRSSASIQ